MVEILWREPFKMACMACSDDPVDFCYIVKLSSGEEKALCEACCREEGVLW